MILAFGRGVASHPPAEGQCTTDVTFLLCTAADIPTLQPQKLQPQSRSVIPLQSRNVVVPFPITGWEDVMGWVMMSEQELNRIEVLSQVLDRRMTAGDAASVLGMSVW